MTFLNNGGGAVDAVEIAIRVLEDKEITNAGWGSNLSMDGTVECDATVVDHYGRSGAVGAVAREFTVNESSYSRLIINRHTKSNPPGTSCSGEFYKATLPKAGTPKLTCRPWCGGIRLRARCSSRSG